MNRLILIGNGFDLAHGLQTSYNHFILSYLKKAFNEAHILHRFEDELLSIQCDRKSSFPLNEFKAIDLLVEHFFSIGILELVDSQQFKLPKGYNSFYNPFTVEIKVEFFREILEKCHSARWVDLENEFFLALIKNLNSRTNESWKKKLNNLNEALAYLIKLLEEYLSNLPTPNIISDVGDILNMPIDKDDVAIEELTGNYLPEQTMVVNFNYTPTVEQYIRANGNFDLNYIHGKLNDLSNPIVFGYGDEMDSNYKLMEEWRQYGYYKYIKTFWYVRTANYFRLVRFIQGNYFQVFVLGHSCGTSDRTMLNMIFEHHNCRSIKLFYHQHAKGNNFNRLIEDISVLFENKSLMRERIVPLTQSLPLPQV